MANLRIGMQLTADGRGFVGSMQVSERALRKFVDAAVRGSAGARRLAGDTERAGRAADKTGGSFRTAHDRMLRYAAGAVGVHTVARAFRSVLDASVRQEQALAQVEARLRSTGGVAGYTAGEIAAMAARFQQATSFGDEAILEMQGVLLSFRSVTGDAFEGATQAVLNLSTALGQDLRSVAIQVGKALDDPKRGLDALSRSGTRFTEAQKEQIRALSAAGRTAEAQAIILRELESQYGGAAVAARDTLGGALAALSNTWGDLLEVQAEASEGLREWVERLNRAFTIAAAATGAGGFVALLAALDPRLPTAAAAVGALAGVVLLGLGARDRARLHAELAHDFVLLEGAGAEPGEDVLRSLRARRRAIESREPPVLRVLDALCHDELITALGLDPAERTEPRWWQRWAANVTDLGAHRLRKAGPGAPA